MPLALAGFYLRAAHSWHRLIVYHKVDCVNHKVDRKCNAPPSEAGNVAGPPIGQVRIFLLRASVPQHLALWANRGPYFENGGRPLGPSPTTTTVEVAPSARAAPA